MSDHEPPIPGFDDLLANRAFSDRFRQVANRYPLQVTDVYGGDLARAMADSD